MADARRFGFSPQLDIGQLVVEAQQRWLRPAEICEILRNYRKFHIAPEPPNMPPSGSLFLFDRKVLRYFRKDGHTWRKKKDGKTVKEAHERLKAEGIDVLHCYYAHGEENENFQRRTYWMLEEAFMHIVLVHYLEVKGNKTSFNRVRDAEGITHAAHMDSPACSNSTMENQIPSHTTDTESTNSVHMSEYEDAESADNYQARSRYHPFTGLQQYEDGSMKDVYSVGPYTTVPSIINHCDNQRPQAITSESDFYSVSQEDKTEVFNDASLGLASSASRSQVNLTTWDEVLEHCTAGFPSDLQPSLENIGGNWEREALTFGELTDDLNIKLKYDSMGQGRDEFQFPCGEVGSSMTSNINLENNLAMEGIANSLSLLKQPSLDLSNIQGEGLKKFDSFTRWMSKELGEVESNIRPSYETYWNSVDNGSTIEDSSMSNPEHLDAYVMSPSVSQDQLFSIIDFFPNWAYTVSETKVLITGSFLKNKKDLENCKWSCMFGEVEVPAEVLVEGLLSCHAPPHRSGTFPFYVTCSNRLACSEVREFEYRVCDTQYLEASDSYSHNYTEMNLQTRLDKLLSLESVGHSVPPSSITSEKRHLSSKISSLLLEADDEWTSLLGPARDEGFSSECMQDLLLQKVLKQRLHDWLIQKLVEDGKGPNIFDKEGQGVLHLAAALGYDWAIKPTITAGVKIDFRDVRGWTALHWAAFCGREKTVISLISLGADPGTLTDPTPGFPSRTPADLASGNGQKGIAGFLAESSLTSHLSALTFKDTGSIDIAEVSGVKPIENIEEQSPIQVVGDDMQASMKDTLSAVRNASLAAARIHQVFRVQSFQRKKVVEYGDDKCGISEERALSLISVKKGNPGQRDMPVLDAAVRIQNKFRGWKGRKEFLIIRQRIVKIQAHVRGHQVRTRYKKITWTVGIVEKVILRWRRKRIGFRGFRGPEGLPEGSVMQTEPPAVEDDYDFFRDGRKQTEARLEKALARVKSMVHYPEARDQYHRLLTAMQNKALNESEEAVDDDTMIDDLEELWGDDSTTHHP